MGQINPDLITKNKNIIPPISKLFFELSSQHEERRACINLSLLHVSSHIYYKYHSLTLGQGLQ